MAQTLTADIEETFHLLQTLGATKQLITHLRLVSQAAIRLCDAYDSLGVLCDHRVIILGAAVHDAGKILHPQELGGPGSLHEAAGEVLLLAQGYPAKLARCCATHGSWQQTGLSLEEKSVALADKLWKGHRETELELAVIDEAAKRLGQHRWDIFMSLDEAFELIAADGPQNLRQTQALAVCAS